jgi:hypothetical protein
MPQDGVCLTMFDNNREVPPKARMNQDGLRHPVNTDVYDS